MLADEPVSNKIGVRPSTTRAGHQQHEFSVRPALGLQLEGPVSTVPAHGAPMLIQGPMSSVRQQLDHWLNKHQLQPCLVGEFDDSALMNAFGREGRGIFLPPVLDEETTAQIWRGSHRALLRSGGGVLCHLRRKAHHPPLWWWLSPKPRRRIFCQALKPAGNVAVVGHLHGSLDRGSRTQSILVASPSAPIIGRTNKTPTQVVGVLL